MEQIKVGSQGLIASRLGLGCMGMTAFYGNHDRELSEEESIKTIETAINNGLNFMDTAWIYQSFGLGSKDGKNYFNEELVGKAIKKIGREKFVIATKFGIIPSSNGMKFSGKEEDIKSQLNDSLTRLGIDCIDLYYQHRMDPSTPIEETVNVLKSLINEGKIKYYGLSECTPTEIRRAHAVHPVTAIQMEYSLLTRDIERDGILDVAKELGITVVAYSPVARGLLTGGIQSLDDLEENDWRKTVPRFAQENIDSNIPKIFFEFAKSKNATPAQLALAWVLAKDSNIIPLFGTKSSERLLENIGCLNIILNEEDMKYIESIVNIAKGERYAGMSGTYNNRL